MAQEFPKGGLLTGLAIGFGVGVTAAALFPVLFPEAARRARTAPRTPCLRHFSSADPAVVGSDARSPVSAP